MDSLKKMCENFYVDESKKFELYISKLFFSALIRDPGIPIIYVYTLFPFTYQNLSFVNDFMKIVWTSLKKFVKTCFYINVIYG